MGAEEDLKAFRDEQEAKFQKETGSKAAADPAAELKGSTKAEIDMVMKDYENNKAKTIQYVVSKVLDVKIELNATQKQALKRLFYWGRRQNSSGFKRVLSFPVVGMHFSIMQVFRARLDGSRHFLKPLFARTLSF